MSKIIPNKTGVHPDGWRIVRFAGGMWYLDGGGLTAAGAASAARAR
ncbi:MAG TPA: hypothetical protein VF933_29140 [Streptosporangiaceae bacterium]